MDFHILNKIVSEALLNFQLISEEEWELKPSPNKWSKKEILGHLCDSAFTNIRRFVITQYTLNETIVYNQDQWVKAQNYQNIPTSEISNLWVVLNRQLVHIVENLSAEDLLKTCDTLSSDSLKPTLDFLAKDYITHLNHHLEAIFKK